MECERDILLVPCFEEAPHFSGCRRRNKIFYNGNVNCTSGLATFRYVVTLFKGLSSGDKNVGANSLRLGSGQRVCTGL